MSIRIDIGPPASPSVSAPAPTAVDLVEARDRAILAFLKDGAASFPAVLNALPEDPTWTNGQREEACRLALRRLVLKNLVVTAGNTYLLSRSWAKDSRE